MNVRSREELLEKVDEFVERLKKVNVRAKEIGVATVRSQAVLEEAFRTLEKIRGIVAAEEWLPGQSQVVEEFVMGEETERLIRQVEGVMEIGERLQEVRKMLSNDVNDVKGVH